MSVNASQGCFLPSSGDPNVTGICAEGHQGGFFLPFAFEYDFSDNARAVVYLALLFWSFIGVAIVSDVFMNAIEKITSKKTTYINEEGHASTEDVWNPTVSNLTLMALGSSAPEILLNVVATFPDFLSSELGPSTIVGSAAFNLLIIIAVCVVSIPRGSIRKVANVGVYSVTASCSIFAYVWLLIILSWNTPDVVEPWEGIATFLFFWVLVVVAYVMDIRFPAAMELTDDTDDAALWRMELDIRRKYGKERLLTDQETALLMHYEFPERYSRAIHRSQAIRVFTGAPRILDKRTTRQLQGQDLAKLLMTDITPMMVEMTTTKTQQTASRLSRLTQGMNNNLPKVSFDQAVYTVLESTGYFSVSLTIHGEVDAPVAVPWKTTAGTAEESDYVEDSGVVEFHPGGVREVAIRLRINKTEGAQETRWFFVDLLCDGLLGAQLGRVARANVTIVDNGDDNADTGNMTTQETDDSGKTGNSSTVARPPGVLRFEEQMISIDASTEPFPLIVNVLRESGNYGKVSCRYCTESDTAIGSKDFIELDGTLEFDHLEEQRSFTVTILPSTNSEGDEIFRVVLLDAEGGVAFHKKTDGGGAQCILTVTIKNKVGCFRGVFNWDRAEIGCQKWQETIWASLRVNGGEDDDDVESDPSCGDYLGHFISLPWKFIFALIPPLDFCEGWVTFFVALFMIGMVTVLIGDLAEILGCLIGWPDSITAITLVALGTSLPDTFASRTAAMWEPTADSSIGNVTGSNSVNVFLGLGLPWTMSALYWARSNCVPGDDWSLKYPEQALEYSTGIFVVPRGNLEGSVTVFCVCGSLCLIGLALRRCIVGGELGGPCVFAWMSATFFIMLWITYIVASMVLAGLI